MKFSKILLTTLCAVTLCGCLASCSTPTDSSSGSQQQQQTTTRNAKNSDLTDVQFSLSNNSVSIRFTPVNDISGLQVKVEFLDSDKAVLDSQIVAVGNVVDGQQYVVNATMANNAFTSGKKASYSQLSVSAGTVTYTVQTGPGIYWN